MAGQSSGSSRHSWRASPGTHSGPSQSKRTRRVFFTILAVAILAVFAWVLWPRFAPVQMVRLPVMEYSELSAPPIAYLQNDMKALDPLSDRLSRVGDKPGPALWDKSGSSAGMLSLGADLKRLVRKGDILIFYLSAHGVSDDGKAYFLCSDFDPANPAAGRVPLSDVLDQISECPAQVKLVLLDAGRISTDARMGMLFNEFPILLEQQVAQCSDSNLWVLSSNSVLETSHVWHAAQRSVFGHFVAKGFEGEADQNGDHTIKLDEFYGYVAGNVSAWLADHGDKDETQTPALLRGGIGAAQPDERVVLMPGPPRKLFTFGKKPPNKDSGPAAEPEDTPTEENKPATESKQTQQKRAVAGLHFLANLRQDPPPAAKSTGDPASAGSAPKAKESSSPGSTQENTTTGGQATKKETPQKPAHATQPEPAPPPDPKEKTPSPDSQNQPPTDRQAAAAVAATNDVGALLQQGWELRDELAKREQQVWTPVDYAPHLWREFNELLLWYEALYRVGGSSDDLAARIRKEILALRELMARPTTGRGTSTSLAERLAQARPRHYSTGGEQFSIAMAELSARHGEVWPATTNQLAVTFDTKRTGDFDEFHTWLTQLPPKNSNAVELKLAQRLMTSNVAKNARAIAAALEACRLAERAAAQNEWCAPWIRQRIDDADRRRLGAERELLTGSAAAVNQAIGTLTDLGKEYSQIRDDATLIGNAINLKNDLLFRAPYYVQWYAQANVDRDSADPSFGSIERLLKLLPDFLTALDPANPASIEAITQQKNELERIARDIESPLRDGEVTALLERISGNPKAVGHARKLEDLLGTPLLAAAQRRELLERLLSLPPVEISAKTSVATAKAATTKTISTEDERRLSRIAKLQALLVRLAVDADSSAIPSFNEVAFNQDARAACRELGQKLQMFYRSLAETTSKKAEQNADQSTGEHRAAHVAALREVDRAVRLLDPRDAKRLRFLRASGSQRSDEEPNPVAWLLKSQLYDLLAWQYRRSELAKEKSGAADVEYFANASERYRLWANRIGPILESSTGSTRRLYLTITPDTVNLADNKTVDLDVSVEVPDKVSSDGPAEVAIGFNADVLEIVRSWDGGLVTPDRREQWPKFSVKPAASATLKYRVKAKEKTASSDFEPKINVKVTAPGLQSSQREIVVALPAPYPVQLVVQPDVAGTVTEEKADMQLRPFPNRECEYGFALRNISKEPQKVTRVELFALPEPPADERRRAISSVIKDGIPLPGSGLRRLAVMETELALEPDEQKVLPFKRVEPSDSPPAAQDGLVWIITNQKSKRPDVRRMDFIPMRPREYVIAKVGYNRVAARIQINLRQKPGAPVLPKGFRAEAEIYDAPPGLKVRSNELKPKTGTDVFLFAEVDQNPRTDVTVRIKVDDYPRAFAYRVNLGETKEDYRELPPKRAIRFTAPKENEAFSAESEFVDATFEVDAADDEFVPSESFVEVGIDMDRNNEFQSEPTRKVFANRQVDVLVQEVETTGNIKFKTIVGDFTVPLPTNRRAAEVPVGLLGLMTIENKVDIESRSPALRIWLDGSKPEVVPLPVESVQRGEDLQVFARATDGQSGVKLVEFAFEDESGKFPTKPPDESKGKLDKSLGQWKAMIPTGNRRGNYTILVRATNNVDMQSDVVPVEVKIEAPPPKKVADAAAPTTVTVKGRVLYNDEAQTGVTVTLTKTDQVGLTPPPAKKAVTNKKGEFEFPDVAVGKYHLFTTHNPRNLSRNPKAESDIDVQPPKQPLDQILKLK